ncbi:hypothetical protein [Streptomyces sp. CB01881]|uniref:hypothetical protein n=1 Tax=Streptomyces sp. CB01881 TaxID=2078691 RepID=UPI000CDC7B19|nr:hypothetical protein [Streptomyces sp. CB01881]AUY48326.1 hypothetical protein C2142_04375 [Streptomyces sp. CB01881]AUY49242.1 hypothetical protein C2142_10135 [Streptomyces sp. CB01881]AUY53561.1 hypothetical protein C2142_37235 [Streptomyces sp. CB01881]AUY53672.1 hypothetical protein C2142_38060 [Streptomyces sp. CB01881]TYC68686.1 hypothetical protein EH183_38060 [Streptomyces sp. CB01881]
MPSVVGLLEQRELTARRRLDNLREEADRIQAELVVAEREWNEWVIARSRVDEVLSSGGDVAGPGAAEEPSDRGEPCALPASSEAAKPKSVVPMWRAGLAWSALSVDYQRILQVLADRNRLGQGSLTCQEMAGSFGLDPVPAKVEALRSKAKRLTARGWLAEPAPGRFTLAKAVAGPGGGS